MSSTDPLSVVLLVFDEVLFLMVQPLQFLQVLLLKDPIGFPEHLRIHLIGIDLHKPIFPSSKATILFDKSSGKNRRKPKNQ
jgi:hypothetical protein